MGLTVVSSIRSEHTHTHKAFLMSNYILIGAATSCAFLTLSLRLIPSLSGLSLIALQTLTIAASVSASIASTTTAPRRPNCYAIHMVLTVLTAIFQGAVAVLIFTRTVDFLSGIGSYVREEDGVVILRLAGGLCVLIFCLEWVVLVLAFVLNYYDYVEGGDEGFNGLRRSGKVGHHEELNDWPWPFQIRLEHVIRTLRNDLNWLVQMGSLKFQIELKNAQKRERFLV